MTTHSMQAGDQFSALARHYESLHDGDGTLIGLQPKMCPAGYWTEGYGSVIKHNGNMLKGAENKALAYKLSHIHNEAQADIELNRIGVKYRAYVLKVGMSLNLTDNQIQALTCLTYNCGTSSFMPNKSVYKAIQTGDSRMVRRAFLLYNKSNGEVMNGLINRRLSEVDLFTENKIQFYRGSQIKI